MKEGFTIEELKKSVRNPFYEKLNREVVVSIRHEDYKIYEDIAKNRGERVRAEDIMRHILADFAKILEEHP